MRAAVSCYEIPALSVVPALTSDYDERTSLTRWRFVFGWAGGLVMLTLAFGFFLVPSEKYPVGQLNLDGYQLYGWTGAVLMILATSVSALTTHRRLAHPDAAPPTHLPLGQTLRKIKTILSNKAFLVLLGSSVFAFVNQGLTFSITAYLLTYYWLMPQAGFIAYSATLFVGVVGVVPYVMVKAFPPVVRFSGLSFSYNVAYAVFGGLTPLVVSLLMLLAMPKSISLR
eukprot:gene21527-27562_t